MKNFKFKNSINCGVLISIMLLISLLVGRLAAQDQEIPTTSDNSQLEEDLTGAWVLAGRPGNVNEDPQVKGSQLKFIAGGQWCITQSDSNGSIIYHHGGTYTLNGDEYTEKVEYANDSTASLINTTLRFNMKVEGDFYTQTGIGNSYTQVWKRLKISSTSDNTLPDIDQAQIVSQLAAQDQVTPTISDSSQLAKDLTGAWIQAGRPGNVNENPQVKGGRIKFIAGGQWCITQSDSNGSIIYHHGGTYTLDGDEYAEKCEYANPNTKYLINTTFRFNMKVEGDFYTQTGIGNPYTEVWKRLKFSSTSDNTPPDIDQAQIVSQLADQDQGIPTTSDSSQLAKDLTGTWILAGRPGNVNENPQVKGGRIKFIAGGYWAITQADPNGEIIYHHGGTYTLNGDEYNERCEYANPNTAYLINTTLSFKMKVEGDTYTQTGIGNPYTEVWKRLNRPLTADNYEESSPSLSVAVTLGDIELVKQLISEGANIEAKNAQGRTPLHIAAANGRIEVAELLIENGADINALHNYGGTPLHLAVNGGHKEMVELLITKGADINVMNKGGNAPINNATQRGYTEIVELLLKYGAKTNLLGDVISGDLADIIESAQTWKPGFTEWYGKPASDFTITDITGKQHKISDYRGKNLIINIWATWCPPCRREIPDIIELRKTISEEDLAILGISTEKGEVDLVKQFVTKEKMNYTILIDEGTFVPPYSQITAIPTTFFIDPKGNIKIATIGVLTLENMKNILQAQ